MIQKLSIQYVIMLAAALFTKPVFSSSDSNTANKYFLEKQKFIFEIVHNLQEPLKNEEWLNMGKTLVLDTIHYLDFNAYMKKYLLKISSNELLPLNGIFIISDENQLEELKGLYYFLFNAQDFETLRQNICWARSHVQSQMFLFALTQILIKREDFRDLNLPKIYEVWPQHFFADKYVRNLQHFNYVLWTKASMYEEYYKDKTGTKTSNCRVGQWWCEKNLQFKIYKEKQNLLLPGNIYGDFRNSTKWSQALEDVTFYWLPVDFSREVADKRELNERSLSYLIEDPSWNSYWYYVNMGLWLNEGEQNDLYSRSLRDWWYWNLQQIVVRYKMENTALSSKIYANPFLINYQGLKFRPTNEKDYQHIRGFIIDLFDKTQNALSEQTYALQNNTILQLNNPQHFEYFLNEHFAIEKVIKAFMSTQNKYNNPTVFQYFETMLRSNEFYCYAETILDLYRALKANFERFKPQDVKSVGVTINHVEITELNTYFELYDTDVTNLLRPSHAYYEGHFLWFKSLVARQQTLQHHPFKFIFSLASDKSQAVLIRTFLARDCSTDENCSTANDFFQLDSFVNTLVNGTNIIERDSKDFQGYMLPSLTYTELYHFTQLALDDKYDFPLNITLGNCRFPHHLKLPKGVQGKGLPVKFVFVITAYNYRFHKASNLDCDFSDGILSFDDFPPGFPFDREIPSSIFMQDNVLIKSMKIYHNDNHF